ncbi:sporulation sigma-E factor-processing peptidase SpoIIGA [Gottschalkia purinilytica]|uniref:Sporulation sigma-E factor-processing peptidase n=1 Tax=Gottschalkia purinilytica TaxID=1503 RepID=A0A0L0WEM0_GOTPU|nr:sigma-E processing peptidase SpoIIGA [Gottschalkia purinilytica]KNF09914.1 sporulation sigma-E factor-processing peptidase SpoIIGA [Gottschalkia purinilytica]
MYIYAEYLLLENLAINYIILFITKKFLKVHTTQIRLLMASLIGALYTFVVFYPSLIFMARFSFKLATSIIIIMIAFNPKKSRSFIKVISAFYLVAFAFAGTSLALFYIADIETYVGGGIFYIANFQLKFLIISVVLIWILFQIVWEYVENKNNKRRAFFPVIINLNGKEIEVTALLDTGNSLKDPISKIPVIVVEFLAIKDILPDSIQNIFLKYKENSLDAVVDTMSCASNQMKFRIIPYKSLGKENGLLLGFKPDKVIVKSERSTLIGEVVIGIYNDTLSNDKEYVALLHPEILT